MKKYSWLYILAFSLQLASCNFLDFDESTGRTQDEAYSYFENVKSLTSAIYRQLPDDYGAIDNALRESATDNAVYTWNNNTVYDIYNDAWSPLNLIDNQWKALYNVIHDANSLLENYSEERMERFKWSPNYEENIEKTRNYLNEVIALRALYYFELAKRYKDVPLLLKTYDLDEVNKVEKTPFSKIVDFIVKSCDEVAYKLPTDYANFYNETGRVTQGAALAFKARTLLYAASPLFVEGDPAEAWKKAAKASLDIINLGVYNLPQIDKDPLYDKNGGNLVLTSPQLIFEARNGDSNSFEQRNWPIGFADGTNSGNTPTQNLVDAYEMKDGTVFDWNNPNHVSNIFYDAQGKETRDPRFYMTILCNGMKYKGTLIETYEGGRFGKPIVGASMTGYYLKKLMNETVSLDPTNQIKKPHHFPTFRYAEVLLNYAEAMNEWKGPEYTDKEFNLSARQALNMVRAAAGMPDVTAIGQEDFREKVRNERRVELAFEDHRFWDIRRWKIGDVVKDIYGINIQNDNGHFIYKKERIQNRIWKDKMYLYPIPQNEIYINPNLTQNPGWDK